MSDHPADTSRKDLQVERVLGCAADAGFIVIDSYAELRRRHDVDLKSFWPLWTRRNRLGDTVFHTGHMSAEGNRVTAELVAAALQAPLASLAGKTTPSR